MKLKFVRLSMRNKKNKPSFAHEIEVFNNKK